MNADAVTIIYESKKQRNSLSRSPVSDTKVGASIAMSFTIYSARNKSIGSKPAWKSVATRSDAQCMKD